MHFHGKKPLPHRRLAYVRKQSFSHQEICEKYDLVYQTGYFFEDEILGNGEGSLMYQSHLAYAERLAGAPDFLDSMN